MMIWLNAHLISLGCGPQLCPIAALILTMSIFAAFFFEGGIVDFNKGFLLVFFACEEYQLCFKGVEGEARVGAPVGAYVDGLLCDVCHD